MLNDLRQTARHIIIYSIGNLSAKLIGFILLPLYTDFLSTEEYGMLAILEITGFLIVSLAGLKLSTAMMRWCSSDPDSDKTKVIAGTTLFSLLVLILITNLIFQPIAGSFSRILFDSVTYKRYFQILFLSVSFDILNLWVLDLLRLKEKPGKYILLTLIKFTAVLILNVFFIKYKGLGVLGIFLSQLSGGALLFLLSLNFLRKNVTLKIDFQQIKPLARYGFPLVFSSLSMYLLTLGDRYIMKYLLDLSDVGVYALGYKIATVSNLLIIQSFQTGFLPIAYKKYEEKGNERFFRKTMTYYAFVLVIFSLAVTLYSKEIILLLARSSDYYIAYTLVPFIALSFVFRGLQYVLSLSLHYVKQTRYNAYIVMAMALFNIGLNFLLQPWLNIYGAALSGVISYFVMLNIFRFYSRKFFNPGYEMGKIFLMIFLGIILYLTSLLFQNLALSWVILLKLALILVFPFILYLFGFYEPIELERIRGAVKKWRHPGNWFTNTRDFFQK